MRALILNRARIDIKEIFKYIALDSPRYAKETIENIYKKIIDLEQNPYIGRYVPELIDKEYREVIYKSYRIIYSISEETNQIYIHFIVHSARNIINILNSYKF